MAPRLSWQGNACRHESQHNRRPSRRDERHPRRNSAPASSRMICRDAGVRCLRFVPRRQAKKRRLHNPRNSSVAARTRKHRHCSPPPQPPASLLRGTCDPRGGTGRTPRCQLSRRKPIRVRVWRQVADLMANVALQSCVRRYFGRISAEPPKHNALTTRNLILYVRGRLCFSRHNRDRVSFFAQTWRQIAAGRGADGASLHRVGGA